MAVKLKVYGNVQGVGFRATMKRLAERYDLTGYAKNLRDGSVEVVLSGDEENITRVRRHLRNSPGFSRVNRVREMGTVEDDFSGFKTH